MGWAQIAAAENNASLWMERGPPGKSHNASRQNLITGGSIDLPFGDTARIRKQPLAGSW